MPDCTLSDFIRQWIRMNPTPTMIEYKSLLSEAEVGDFEAIKRLPEVRDRLLAEARAEPINRTTYL